MYVAGIDAHTTYRVAVVVSKEGERVLGPERFKVERIDQLVERLSRVRPLEAVVETSPSWPWLHDRLTAEGIRFVLAHAKRLRIIAEANCKTDEVDAELLARMRLAGLIPAVHARALDQREWAVLVRHRAALVRHRTRLASQVHAQLHAVGLRLERGRLLTRAGYEWIRTFAWPKLGGEQRRLIRTHYALIRHLSRQIKGVDRRIRWVADRVPEARLLQTIPGIGAYRALLIAAEVLPITRFAKPTHLVSYAGLAPRSARSGLPHVRYGSIPGGANRWLRGALVRAVVSHTAHAPQSALSAAYAEIKGRLGWQVARVATARKLARVIHAVLRRGTPWQPDGLLAEPEPPTETA